MRIVDIIKKTNIDKDEQKPVANKVNAEQQNFVNILMGEKQSNGK